MSTLAARRAKVFEDIKAAAAAGDSPRVLAATAKLSAIEEFARRQVEIDAGLEALDANNWQDPTASSQQPAHIEIRTQERKLGESARARGDRLRLEFVQQLSTRGYRLVQVRGALFKNKAGEQIGIAYASQNRPQWWFLGLPEDSFHGAILLIEAEPGQVTAMCLPHAFFSKYGTHLSRSRGQLKFNVALRGGHYVIVIPNVGPVSADQYVNNYGKNTGGPI
jgi:hypothetical protein